MGTSPRAEAGYGPNALPSTVARLARLTDPTSQESASTNVWPANNMNTDMLCCLLTSPKTTTPSLTLAFLGTRSLTVFYTSHRPISLLHNAT